MGAIFDWIEKELTPPGIRQDNRRKLFKIVGRIGQQVAEDIAASKREFFAYSASATALGAHGKSKNIPRWPTDTDESYLARLVSAANVLSQTGEEASLKKFLNTYVPGRWILMDIARGYFQVGSARVGKAHLGRTAALVLYIIDLIPEEEKNISAFLDWFLGPDIEYVLMRHGRADEESLERFLNKYVPNRWSQSDMTSGYYHVGSARIGATPIASQIEVVFQIADLTGEEKTEIEEFLAWFYWGSKEYTVQSTAAETN